MTHTSVRGGEPTAVQAGPSPRGAVGSEDGVPAATANPPPPAGQPAAPTKAAALATSPAHRRRKRLLMAGAVVGLAVGAYFLVPRVETALNTVSTDDAYVNGHV